MRLRKHFPDKTGTLDIGKWQATFDTLSQAAEHNLKSVLSEDEWTAFQQLEFLCLIKKSNQWHFTFDSPLLKWKYKLDEKTRKKLTDLSRQVGVTERELAKFGEIRKLAWNEGRGILANEQKMKWDLFFDPDRSPVTKNTSSLYSKALPEIENDVTFLVKVAMSVEKKKDLPLDSDLKSEFQVKVFRYAKQFRSVKSKNVAWASASLVRLRQSGVKVWRARDAPLGEHVV